MPLDYYKVQILMANSKDWRLYYNVDKNVLGAFYPEYSNWITHIKKKEDEEKKKNNLLLYIIIGGAGLILIVGILIVIIMCAKRRKSEEPLNTEE